jgi:hypothetical protein
MGAKIDVVVAYTPLEHILEDTSEDPEKRIQKALKIIKDVLVEARKG